MRQKIKFEKNLKAGLLTVVESSEVDPGVVMPLIKEEYDLDKIAAASKEGLDAFSGLLRRRSFFPTADLTNKLYESTVGFFNSNDKTDMVIEYDDAEAFPQAEDFSIGDDDVELDQILEEDGDSKEDEIKEIDSNDDTPQFKPEDISEHEN